jgi:hypothetical protein
MLEVRQAHLTDLQHVSWLAGPRVVVLRHVMRGEVVDTTHVVTNPRVSIDGDTARLSAIVDAQHLLSSDHGKFALLKNFYETELIRAGSVWVLRCIRISDSWYRGEPALFFGG